MKVLRSADYKRMPWKNGGGETVEIIVSPEHAGFDTFDWRISMAHVAMSGPFSSFPQIDRNLTVIAGKGIALAFDRGDTIQLDQYSAPLDFPGDVAVEGILTDGPIEDLNVMTRRGKMRQRVLRHGVTSTPANLSWQGDVGVLVNLGQQASVTIDGASHTLGLKDALILGADDAREFTASSTTGADVMVIEISAA
jgi:environmental stress-induced protein Ves